MFSQTWIMGKSKLMKVGRLWMLQCWNFFIYVLEYKHISWNLWKLAYNKGETQINIFFLWGRSLHVETRVFACMRTFFHPKIIPNQTVPVGHSLHRPLTMLSFFLYVSVSDFFSVKFLASHIISLAFCLCFLFFLSLRDEDSPVNFFQKLLLRHRWLQWYKK